MVDLHETLQTLIRKNQSFYRNLCAKYVTSPARVEECLQDGYGKFLACGRSFDSLEDAEPFLCRLLVNHFIDAYREEIVRRKHEQAMPENPAVIASRRENPEGVILERQRAGVRQRIITEICRRLERLPAHQRELVERVAAETQPQRGCQAWQYSLDFNERCPNVQYVLDFLGKLREVAPAALARVQYIEQPTHRDLRANPENKMHAAAKIKPVVIDESLVDFESLQLSRELGYSGVALKACKGHSEALLMGAAAQKYQMFLCVQDLTCVGASFLHSASLSARIPTIAAIEGNGRQYCPAGNQGWEERFPGMFRITGGVVETGELSGTGLGF